MTFDRDHSLLDTPHTTLVAGVDGSGKTTFLMQLAKRTGYVVLEPTSTPEAQQFKADHVSTSVDTEFIDRRESLFVALNEGFDATVSSHIGQGERVATTGNGIVTTLSHAVMRQISGNTQVNSPAELVANEWERIGKGIVDVLVLVHAPYPVILERIHSRQDEGLADEVFWGFNSPYFLGQYQDAWNELFGLVQEQGNVTCVKYNSAELSPQEMIRDYTATILGE